MSIAARDHIAISRLMYRYARCADNKDYSGFAEVFTEDAVFLYAGEPVTPLSAIQEMMLALEKYTRTLHQVNNILYDVDGDIANGETYCLASHLYLQDDAQMKIDMGIIYRDTLVRTARSWRITRREFDLLWSSTSEVDSSVG